MELFSSDKHLTDQALELKPAESGGEIIREALDPARISSIY